MESTLRKTGLVLFIAVAFVFSCSLSALAGWTGGHDVVGTPAARKTWYFAEGCSRNGFNTWLCLFNPGAAPARVRVTYYIETGESRNVTVPVPGRSRATLDAGTGCGGEHDIASEVVSDLPIVAERSEYFDIAGISGGHVAMGLAAAQRDWYFAEGCTAAGFTEWMCLFNPSDHDVTATVQYMFEQGKARQSRLTVRGHCRRTLNVGTLAGAAGSVSVRITGNTSKDLLVCERAMYFRYHPGELDWTGGHVSSGTNDLATSRQFAEGCTRPGFETWLLLQNPNSLAASGEITCLMNDGETAVGLSEVAPLSRVTIRVSDNVGGNKDVSMRVASDVPIACERSMYFSYGGAWDGGSVSSGTPCADPGFLFAEGSSRPGFDTWICVLNPGPSPAAVNLSFFSDGADLTTRSVSVPGESRATYSANEIVGPGHDFALEVTSSSPVVVERPMYFDYQGTYSSGPKVTARFLSVGKADSCILRMEDNGETCFVLVDAGGAQTPERVISALRDMGCSRLDVMVLTHPDDDHVGGAAAVLRAIEVDQEWDPGIDGGDTQAWRDAKSIMAKKGIPRIHPRPGQVCSWAGVKTTVLNPPSSGAYESTNDSSIVLLESIGSMDLMLAGDAEVEAQRFMMTEGLEPVEVLKVPHHGAEDAWYQPFYDAIRPAAGIISVGKNSRGYPSAAVINLLSSFGAVYRTDLDGDITVRLSANAVRIDCATARSTAGGLSILTHWVGR